MLRSVDRKYDGFMTWLSWLYDFTEQGKKLLVNTWQSATLNMWTWNGGRRMKSET
jgi:hypothetical protein